MAAPDLASGVLPVLGGRLEISPLLSAMEKVEETPGSSSPLALCGRASLIDMPLAWKKVDALPEIY
jgi:hypothetical protein